MKQEAILKIHGNVQGVFYRAHAQERADELGLAGWVRNMADGSVEMCLQGDENVINEMIDWCYEGPPASQVDEIEVSRKELDSEKELSSFEIRY